MSSYKLKKEIETIDSLIEDGTIPLSAYSLVSNGHASPGRIFYLGKIGYHELLRIGPLEIVRPKEGISLAYADPRGKADFIRYAHESFPDLIGFIPHDDLTALMLEDMGFSPYLPAAGSGQEVYSVAFPGKRQIERMSPPIYGMKRP